MLRLRFPTGPFPSGGYAFTDQRTGLAFNGMEATLDMQVEKIIKHRAANRRLYPAGEPHFFDKAYVKQEVLAALHARHPQLFVNGPQPHNIPIEQRVNSVAVQASPSSRACPKCGSLAASAIYCATCGAGNTKLTGWKCSKCGTRRGK